MSGVHDCLKSHIKRKVSKREMVLDRERVFRIQIGEFKLNESCPRMIY